MSSEEFLLKISLFFPNRKLIRRGEISDIWSITGWRKATGKPGKSVSGLYAMDKYPMID